MRRRQLPDGRRRTGLRVDSEDLRVLRRRVAAAEQVIGAPQADGGRVVQGEWEPSGLTGVKRVTLSSLIWRIGCQGGRG